MVTKGRFLPDIMVYGVLFLCVAPMLLILLGFDFSSVISVFPDDANISSADRMFFQLRGVHHHALLEWTGVSIALLTVLLAFSHYAVKYDVATPIIGLALLSSGVMDAFHTLGALRIIGEVGDNRDFIPFTWMLSRSFGALVMLVGVGVLLLEKKNSKEHGFRHILLIGSTFLLISYGIMYVLADNVSLPQTMYPDALISRPFDLLPLFLFIIAGFAYYELYKKVPSFFSAAVLLSVVPAVVLELHMVFGSSQLFDSHFNIAHFLKIIVFIVPFIGLVLDYIQTYEQQHMALDLVEKTQKELLVEVEEKEQTQIKLSEYMEGLSLQNIELGAAREEADNANKSKSSFLANMSHEIRTPLNGVIGLTELLLNTELNEKQRRYAGTVYSSAELLLDILNDILDFSKIEAGELHMEIIPYNLHDICTQVGDVFELKAEQKGLGFNISLDDGLSSDVCGDPTRMRQIILNLVGNAIKFTKQGSVNVIFFPDEDENFFRVKVVDTGIGIDEDKCSHVFEKFSQEDASTTRVFGGTGLGLAISRQLVEMMGGEIGVNSKAGQGSTFWIRVLKEMKVEDETVF